MAIGENPIFRAWRRTMEGHEAGMEEASASATGEDFAGVSEYLTSATCDLDTDDKCGLACFAWQLANSETIADARAESAALVFLTLSAHTTRQVRHRMHDFEAALALVWDSLSVLQRWHYVMQLGDAANLALEVTQDGEVCDPLRLDLQLDWVPKFTGMPFMPPDMSPRHSPPRAAPTQANLMACVGCYDMAAQIALEPEDESASAALRTVALSRRGAALMTDGNLQAGVEALQAALDLLQVVPVDEYPWCVQFEYGVKMRLARWHEDEGRLLEALSCQKDAVQVLRTSGADTAQGSLDLCRLLLYLARLCRKTQQHSAALGHIQEAFDIVVHCSDVPRLLAMQVGVEMVQVVTDAPDDVRKASRILQALEHYPMLRSAFIGDSSARSVAALPILWEGTDVTTDPESAANAWPTWLSSRDSLMERNLLVILNTPSSEIEALRDECYRASIETEEHQRQLLGVAMSLPSPDLLARRARALECFRMLQRLADTPACRSIATGKEELQFPGFTQAEIDVLRKHLELGRTWSEYLVSAETADTLDGPPWIAAIASMARGPDAPCYLCVQTGEVGPDRPGELSEQFGHLWARHLWEAFDVLMRSYDGKQWQLRRCTVPRHLTHHLDYELGERDDRPQVCGRFYIAGRRRAKTCGRPVCKQNQTAINKLAIELRKRAEQIARAEFKKHAPDGSSFDDFYDHEMARHAPRKALLHFRERLESSRNSDGRKK